MTAELLAPAGSYEAMKAAFLAGADAVYLGGERFGARAYAVNFNKETLLAAIDEAHLFDKKLYLTVNTVIKDDELEDLYEFILPYYRAGLDAVIVQDTGALKLISENFPGLHIHASTQMAVTGYHGAKLLEKHGVTRVIPARELSAGEIRQIRKNTGLEIECFVHGALCYCYSGQCLMSSFLGGRSGNRGRCAQPCRLPYRVFCNGQQISDKSSAYALNTKDICTVDILPEILAAGVDSLKIEGRMKRPEYTAGVVSVYRKYLDLMGENGDRFHVAGEDQKLLRDLFNRDGFSKSYYFTGNGPEMMALRNVKNEEETLRKADVVYKKIDEEILSGEMKITLFAKVKAQAGGASLELSKDGITVKAETAEVYEARNKELRAVDLERQLGKTGGTPYRFVFEKIEAGEGLFMPAGAQNELRRTAVSAFTEKKLEGFRREIKERFPLQTTPSGDRFKGTGFYNSGEMCDNKASIAVLVHEISQAEEAMGIPQVNRVYLPVGLFAQSRWQETAERLEASGKEVSIALSQPARRIDRPEYSKLLDLAAEKGYLFLAASLEDAAGLLERGSGDRIRLDGSVYTLNRESLRFWRDAGILSDTVPYELSRQELKKRDNHASEMVVYGRVPLMVSAQCVKKNYDRCTKDNAVLYLRDRKNYSFPVYCDCFECRNTIYNPLPLSLLSKKEEVMELGCGGYRFEFTDEPAVRVRKLLHAWTDGVGCREDFQFTRGHFNRGVE